MATINFNAQNVEPQQSFSPIPAGTYIAQAVDSDIKTTKAGTGQYLSLQFEVLEGEFARRRIFTNITISNQNQQAESIGQSELSALCRAVGVMQLQDSTQLHGRPVKIRVAIKQDAQYGDRNEIKGYEAAPGQGVASPMAAAPASQAAAPAAANTPPWQRSA